jgi:hypothetical protein
LTSFFGIGELVYSSLTGFEFKSIDPIEDSILKLTAFSDSTLFLVVGDTSGDSGAIFDIAAGV